MGAMITMAAEANNDGNNLSGYLKWFSTVSGVLFLGFSWRKSVLVGCFY